MWIPTILIVAIATSLPLDPVQGAERQPFHVSHFDRGVTVNLTITSVMTSLASEYDFDVTIGLIELNGEGAVQYLDDARHGARVNCAGRGKVFVGGTAYVPSFAPGKSDWKVDLLKSVCNSPVS
ncbi:hypothetical protein PDO_5117 [Rhizobium sp. PDO1-076]|uniref:hypothetical protein n=1 Tax=Rhizobium sp. PDO1-076 TaxID=1125979 RepID=UPI00024E30A7|nr:hypothetical protein [Rhizobium sp. PDO1-076]EHS51621.1 hypothetical protein PDO_5117 [Rhizobium sp. PDO1-076]